MSGTREEAWEPAVAGVAASACPFCGSNGDLMAEELCDAYDGTDSWAIYCEGCGGRIYADYATKREAIEAWNLRAERDALREQVRGMACARCGKINPGVHTCFDAWEAWEKRLAEAEAQRDTLRERLNSQGIIIAKVVGQRDELADALDYMLARSKYGLTRDDWSIEAVEALLASVREESSDG